MGFSATSRCGLRNPGRGHCSKHSLQPRRRPRRQARILRPLARRELDLGCRHSLRPHDLQHFSSHCASRTRDTETRGKGLLISRKKIAATFTILGFDVLTLFLVVYLGEHFWMGWPIFFGSLATIGILIYLAYKAPARSLRARTDNSLKSPKVLGIVGTLFYPAILFTEFGGMAEGIPAFPVVILIVLVQALFLVYVLRNMGRQNNERNVIAFALGLILPIAVFGNVGEITLPMTLILDFVMLLFFRKLWKEY